MTLQEIFAKAEGGVLTYEQFAAIAQEQKAKFVDLTEGNYVSKQKYDNDVETRDNRINTLDTTIKEREGDIGTLKSQLEAAGTDAAKLTTLSEQFNDLQTKYDTATQEYQAQLKEQAYKYAVNELASQNNFTSQAAKRDFISSMLAKQLQMENDTIIGANDFVAAYAQENSDAFLVADDDAGQGGQTKPHFVDTTKPASAGDGGDNPFQFNFVGVRPHDNQQN